MVPGQRVPRNPGLRVAIPVGLYERQSLLDAMPQSLSAIYIHLTFSTKERRPLLRDKTIRDKLHA
jgi:hypothetical protein